MCLILVAHEVHERYRLVLAANRDEFHERPTAPAAFWGDAPDVLGGRDLRGGGTWLGITRTARWAAVTNFRSAAELTNPRPQAPSRGALVRDFLTHSWRPAEYLRAVAEKSEEYSGFNLLVGDGPAAGYYSNRDGPPSELSPGVYGVSNALLDVPWPKVERGKEVLTELVRTPAADPTEPLFDFLGGRTAAADHRLPDTGVGAEMERLLSAPFIVSPAYGTRASTVVLVDHDGCVRFVERSFRPGRPGGEEARYTFRITRESEPGSSGRNPGSPISGPHEATGTRWAAGGPARRV